jgi:hypothetical protein
MPEYALYLSDSEIGLLRACLNKGHEHFTADVRDELRVIEAKIGTTTGSGIAMAEPDADSGPGRGGEPANPGQMDTAQVEKNMYGFPVSRPTAVSER